MTAPTTTKDDGGSAFPVPMVSDGKVVDEVNEHGMSLRDYFAGHALTGMLVHMADWRSIGGEPVQVAEWAYELADAMLAERSKP